MNVEKQRRATQEFLFVISAEYCGWNPDKPVLWVYPYVHAWEQDENGYYVIPSIVVFRFDRRLYMEANTLQAFRNHLVQATGSEWELDWNYRHQGLIPAMRIAHTMMVTPPGSAESHNVKFPATDVEYATVKISLIRMLWRGLIHDDWRRRIEAGTGPPL